MKKSKLRLSNIPESEVNFRGKKIQISPYISFENQIIIAENYLSTLFSEETSLEHRRITAEYALIVSVIDLCTSINIDDEGFYEKAVSTGLWDAVRGSILNYEDFRKVLEESVEHVMYSTSLSNSVNRLINNINSFLIGLSDMDVSPEGIEKLSEQFVELSSGLSEIKKTLGQSPEEENK